MCYVHDLAYYNSTWTNLLLLICIMLYSVGLSASSYKGLLPPWSTKTSNVNIRLLQTLPLIIISLNIIIRFSIYFSITMPTINL